MESLGDLVRLNAGLIAQLLRSIAEQLEPGKAAVAFPVVFDTDGRITVGQITVKDSDPALSATVTFLDAKGATTEPDDVPQWSSSDDAVATVLASEDGKSATVTIGSPGAAIISVDSTDTDGTQIHAEGTVTVQAGEAVSGDVEFAPGP